MQKAYANTVYNISVLAEAVGPFDKVDSVQCSSRVQLRTVHGLRCS